MLIEFTVENFRSIKDSVTLSAIAVKSSSRAGSSLSRRRYVKPDSEIAHTYVAPRRRFEVLPLLAIYGANASGKTNVLMALDELLYRMYRGISNGINGHSREWGQPFLFDEYSRALPTKFNIRLLVDEKVYDYSLSVGSLKVYEETLEYMDLTSARMHSVDVFSRHLDDRSGESVIELGQKFKQAFKVITSSISPSVPFISVLLNYFNDPILRPLANWCAQRQAGLSLSNEEDDGKRAIASALVGYNAPCAELITLLKNFDTGIEDVFLEFDNPELSTRSNFRIKARHVTDFGFIDLDWDQESHGTQRMLAVLAKIVIAARLGGLIIIDELDSSLHPNIVHEIVRMFQDPRSNRTGAQIIFSTHDATLLSHNRLRRDQVWFAQKRNLGDTKVFPLTDFSPRNDLVLDNAYLDGRLGAVPRIPDPDLLDLVEAA